MTKAKAWYLTWNALILAAFYAMFKLGIITVGGY